MDKIKSKSGQALVEYVLLLAIVVAAYGIILKALTNSSVMTAMQAPFTKDYKYTYEYWHKDARGGQADGGPLYIPQCSATDQNFRIFINPPISQ